MLGKTGAVCDKPSSLTSFKNLLRSELKITPFLVQRKVIRSLSTGMFQLELEPEERVRHLELVKLGLIPWSSPYYLCDLVIVVSLSPALS